MKSVIHKAFLGLASCIFGLFSISAMADTFYFVHNDHLGAPLVITDENKQVVWEVDRDPWGNITNQITNALPNNVSLPGQYYDVETGYHQNWNRDYDPSTGRYLQSDPIGLAGGINTYGYAYQNPVMYTDFMGLTIEQISRALKRVKQDNPDVNVPNKVSASYVFDGKDMGITNPITKNITISGYYLGNLDEDGMRSLYRVITHESIHRTRPRSDMLLRPFDHDDIYDEAEKRTLDNFDPNPVAPYEFVEFWWWDDQNNCWQSSNSL